MSNRMETEDQVSFWVSQSLGHDIELRRVEDYILSPLREKCGINAVVYGGMLRDRFFGKSYRDIDIVIGHDEAIQNGGIRPTELLFGDQVLLKEEHFDKGDAEYDHSYVSDQYAGELNIEGLYWKPEVNLIFWGGSGGQPTVNNVADLCDYGLCQIAWNGRDFYASEHFWNDIADGAHTLVRTEWGVSGSDAHYERLNAKYPAVNGRRKLNSAFNTSGDANRYTPYPGSTEKVPALELQT